jgi:stage V sporulation protein G
MTIACGIAMCVRVKGVIQMQITDIRIRSVEKEGKMKAVVSITIDDEFVVHDIKIIEGEKGMFIAMPSRKAADGEYRDIAHPINTATRERLQSMILSKYQESLEE